MMQTRDNTQSGLLMVSNESEWFLNEFRQEALHVPFLFFSLEVDNRDRAIGIPLFQMNHFVVESGIQIKP